MSPKPSNNEPPTLEELQEQVGRVEELSDEELTDLEANLREAATQAHADQDVESLTTLVESVETVQTTINSRAEAAAEQARQADELMARIAPAETEETEAEETPQPEAQAEETPVEQTPQPESTPARTEAEAEAEAEETEQEQPEAVAAAAEPTPPAPATQPRPAPRRPSPAGMSRHRPARNEPRPQANEGQFSITAAADIPNVPAGQRLGTLRDVARAMIARHNAFRGHATAYQQVPVATFGVEYPEDRRFTGDAQHNQKLIDAIMRPAYNQPDTVIAAGGLCAPVTPSYSQANISSAERRVRDSLAGFQAPRGGVRFIEPLVISDFDGAVGEWTAANDANPTNPATKPCLTVECGTETEVLISAITRCLQFGNLGARAFPEQVEDAIAKSIAWQAREAERILLREIGSNSTDVTSGQLLGAARDILATFDRAAASYRNRHRTAENFPLRAILPAWAKNMIRADLTRELPGSTAERLATADAEIDRFFAARYINVTWALDGEPGESQEFGLQGPGALINWPTNVVGYLFHEGAFLFLDGGELDVGIIRDSDLVSTNDYRMFGETFENVAFVGLESLKLTMDVCPDGATSATVAIDPCTVGS